VILEKMSNKINVAIQAVNLWAVNDLTRRKENILKSKRTGTPQHSWCSGELLLEAD
jgi:hypothetical protein